MNIKVYIIDYKKKLELSVINLINKLYCLEYQPNF